MTAGIEIRAEQGRLLLHLSAWGAEGWGETPSGDAGTLRALLDGLIIEAEDFPDMLDARDPPAALRAAIACAWMSARAMALGVPLAGMLAQSAPAAPAIPLCGLIPALLPDQAATRAAALAEAGFTTLQVACGRDHAADLARVAAVRGAAPRAKLRLDAGGAWGTVDSLADLRALSNHDIEHVVRPLPASRPVAELLAFRRASPVAVAASVRDAAVLARIVAHRAADLIVVDPARAGGPDRAAALLRAAEEGGMAAVVASTDPGRFARAVALHVAALLPAPLPACAIPGEAPVAEVPHGPGLGAVP